MPLLPVEDALARLLTGAAPLGSETVGIGEAAGRVLALPVLARRTQPPFDASAMDGYAVRAADVATLPAQLTVAGESAAGRRFAGTVGASQAVRIFTGAPVPEGADAILIQENVTPLPDGRIEAFDGTSAGRHIRRAGLDFRADDVLVEAGRVLDPGALALAASGNNAEVSVVRRPAVAIIATGDELVPPGQEPGPDQIVASNTLGIAAMLRADGANVFDLGIAPDDRAAIAGKVRAASEAGADVIVTVGGASVGDHDLVKDVLEAEGMALDFWKIAMRPGKPLMVGRLGGRHVIGLPGNPVSSLVCAHLFLRPLVAMLAGRDDPTRIVGAILGTAMPANDQRQDYVRATTETVGGRLVVTPMSIQDSSMLRSFAASTALVIRPPHAPAAAAGAPCSVLLTR